MPDHSPDIIDSLPLFPLPRVVLLPHTLLPLHIFEPRYRALVASSIEDGLIFGIPTIREGGAASDACPPFHSVMGLAQIVRHQDLPDGRSNIVVLGVGRAELLEELDTPAVPYRVARCRRLDDIRDPTPPAPQTSAKLNQLRLAAMQVVYGRADVTEDVECLLTPDRDPAEVVDVLAHMCLRCATDRLEYLKLSSFSERADLLLATLTSILYAKRDVPED